VSKYFKFKTIEALLEAAEALGVALEATENWSSLASGLSVGGRRVGNRLAIQPMEGCDGTNDGHPGELTLRRYERFGAGGAKLIWGEAAAVAPEGRANPRQLIATDAHADSLARIVTTVRSTHRAAWGDDSDLLVGLQLTHSGRYSFERPILAQHDSSLDPRTFVDRRAGIRVAPEYPLVTDDELLRLQDRYVAAAHVADRAGFDFIDLKQCHRYLLNELLAAKTRPGRYGGSFENRTRFVRELVERLRADVPGMLIATRLNVFDGVPYDRGPSGVGEPWRGGENQYCAWGTSESPPFEPDTSEPIRLLQTLESLGVGLVNVTLGNPYASPHLLRPFEYAPVDGYEPPEHPLLGVGRHLRLAAEIQRALPRITVVGSGYSWLQEFLPHVAAAQVAAGRVSVIGVGRGSLSQPDFARNVLNGKGLDRKRTCRTFSYCTALMRSKKHPLGQFETGCPPFDREGYGEIWLSAQRSGTAPVPGADVISAEEGGTVSPDKPGRAR
jgi:2,4-dienoyl-CoA reductase-like NADH-dependent reductase (Old Yellow Enzyme family)